MNGINTHVLVVPFKYFKHKTKLISALKIATTLQNKTKVCSGFCGQKKHAFF